MERFQIPQPQGQSGSEPDINADPGGKLKVPTTQLEELTPTVRQPPQRGAQVARCVAFAGIGPEHARNIRTEQRTIMEGKKREQSFCRQRQNDCLPIPSQLEAAKESQMEPRSRVCYLHCSRNAR